VKIASYNPQGFALQIFKDRYAIHDEETFPQACERVARTIADAELGTKRDEYFARFMEILQTNRFSPGGRIWRGAGRPRGQLMNCFVWTDDLDSREGWGDALRAVTIISGTGGGVGINFSRVRPRGTLIRGTGGEATGSVSLMRAINSVCNELREGGGRRSALMFCLKYDHPDLMEFLEAKLDKNELNNANISVCIDTNFLKLLDEHGEVVFKWQGEERGRVPAKDIWDKIVSNAWKSGDPGLLNSGMANTMNTISYRHDLVSTNPCFTGEMRLHTHLGMVQFRDLVASGIQDTIVAADNRTAIVGNTKTPWINVDMAKNGIVKYEANNVRKTGDTQQIYKLTTSHGHEIRCTAYHRFPTPNGIMTLKELATGDTLLLQSGEGLFGKNGSYDDGLIIGLLTGDGTLCQATGGNTRVCLDFWNNMPLAAIVCSKVNNVLRKWQADHPELLCTNWKNRSVDIKITNCAQPGKVRIQSELLGHYLKWLLKIENLKDIKNRVPEMVWTGSKDMVVGYLSGIFEADGTSCLSGRLSQATLSVRLSQSNKQLLSDVQILLGNLKVISRLYKRRDEHNKLMPNGHNGVSTYKCRSQYELIINRPNAIVFEQQIGFIGIKQEKLSRLLDERGRKCREQEKFVTQIKSIDLDGTEDVYCLSQPKTETIIVNGVVTLQCGEIWMSPYDCCCLGAVNLHTHVVDGSVDWDLLEETVAMSVRFLDDVLDQNNYPMPIIQETCQKHRRIGLGVMGLHDMLLELGLKYSTQDARDVVDKVMAFVKKQAYHASITLAIEKGSFHALDVNQHIKTGFVKKCLGRRHHRLIREHGIRNCALLTIAPTGTTSIVAGCSSGIEPLFQPVYERRFNQHKEMHNENNRDSSVEVVVHPLLKKFIQAGKSTKHFQGAHDITPEEHLLMQVVCQKHIDNSISKTINITREYSLDKLSEQMRRYIAELKGITVYRDGSRGESPLVPLPLSKAKLHLDKMEAEAAVNDCPNGSCDTEKGVDKNA
jgi:ribonucleoside-diphosphate reductase alpha chain